ncbi:MAG: Rnase Y domain-containing protein, partial [Thermodesulfovibrionales bacterium]
MFNVTYLIVAVVLGVLIGAVAALIVKSRYKVRFNELEQQRKRVIDEAARDSEKIKKEAALEAKDIVYNAKAEIDKELHER